MPLAASPQTSEPDYAAVITEGRQQVCVGRHREVGEVACHHGPEPPSLLVDRRMPEPSQCLLDLPELGFHSLSLCLAPELEVGAVLPGGAVVCQPQEIERFRLALAPLCPALGSVSAELKEAGLFRVQAERELRQAFLEIDQETLRYGSAYAGLRLCHGFPTLCPDRALQFRIPLGPIVSLHRLRGGSLRFVRQLRRYYR